MKSPDLGVPLAPSVGSRSDTGQERPMWLLNTYCLERGLSPDTGVFSGLGVGLLD